MGDVELGADNIYVAIDFGTTRSGYAFAIGRKTDKIVIQPEADGRKVDTTLLLNADGSLDSFGRAAWDTYDAMDDEERKSVFFFDRFKMTLFNDRDISPDQPIKARCSDKTFPAKVVFGRALQYFYKRASERIQQSCGVSAWREDEVKWIITVPAIWGDRAKAFMVEAAKEAGIWNESYKQNFTIALEPEAAALCCRDDLLQVWRNRKQPDVIRYMVVDCGGGTIDFTVHDLTVETTAIDEVHRATGNDWGGTKVNDDMKKFIVDIIGEEAAKNIPEDDWLKFEREQIEEAKLRVDSNLDRVSWTISSLPPVRDPILAVTAFPPGIAMRRRSTLVFEKEKFKHFFQPSLDAIASHTRRLIADVPDICCILLVGGYAECPFLFDRLHHDFNTPLCPVVRPSNADLAIIKGAVLFGQNPEIIKTRIAKNTYGLRKSIPFLAGKHPKSKKVTGDDGDYCCDIFEKVVEIGTPLMIGKVFKKTYPPLWADGKSMLLSFYRVCSPKKEVEYTDDPDCEWLCTMRVPLTNVEKRVNRKVTVQVDFSGTHLHFTATEHDSCEVVKEEVNFF